MKISMEAMTPKLMVVAGKTLSISLFYLLVLFLRHPPSWLTWAHLKGFNPDAYCIFDLGHYIFSSCNIIVRETRQLGYPLQLFSSLMIDITFLYAMLIFIFEAQTARVLYSVIIFYGIRAIIQVEILDTRLFSLSRSLSDRLGRRLTEYLRLWCRMA